MSGFRIGLAPTLVLALFSTAAAQPTAQTEVPPPPPAQTQAPAQTPWPAQAPAQAQPPAQAPQACVPACRSGYLCEQGQCVSACNPPCEAGTQCSGHGECVARSGGAPAPLFPSPEPPIAPPPDPGKERHDGFMLRLALGFGSGHATQKASDSAAAMIGFGAKTEYSGFSGSFSVDIGGALTDNLVLHARFSEMAVVEPNVTVDGADFGSAKNTSLTALLFGPAITYYFMPANVYVTGAIGVSGLETDNGGGKAHGTKAGPGLNLDVGKEWWVSHDWGLGVAGRFWYTHCMDTDTGVDLKYDFLGWGILFSATYQ
jgi:hypothetical protein